MAGRFWRMVFYASILGLLRTRMRKHKRKPSKLAGDSVETLDDMMTPSDLIWILERLKFAGGECLLSVDPGIRDYLIQKLRDRRQSA
jgi:hypothetical protein